MIIKNLPEKYKKIWQECIPLFKEGRPGDDLHAIETVEFILNYKGDKRLDLDILIPVAMMHDIGHSAILSEHFKYITGTEKLINSKLVHMLIGAKIAKTILNSVSYDKKKIAEIVNIISVHDWDQLNKVDVKKVYDTENKKIFHDIDVMDRFSEERIEVFIKKMEGMDREKLMRLLKPSLDTFFYTEFREIAKKKMQELENGGQ